MIFGRKKITTLSDLDLIKEYHLNRDQRIIGEIYNRYGRLVYGVCLKYLKQVPEAQDMCMKVFEKLQNILHKQDPRNLASWLHVISKNECLMFLRKQGKISDTALNENLIQASEENEIEQVRIKESRLTDLEKAVEQLNPEQRQCIELFYLKEKRYQEVAEETGFTLKQVKSFIQNGKRNLKIYLQNNPSF